MIRPPVDKIPEFLVLKRTPYSDDVEILYPDQNSYQSNIEETEKLLETFGSNNAIDICLTLQNFNLVLWRSRDDHHEIINLYADEDPSKNPPMIFNKPLRIS